MDIFVARQPIFNRELKLFGYELLYRSSEQNYFVWIDDDQATESLIYNSFLVMGLSDITDETVALINFSKALIDSEAPYLLPSERVIVEVLERENATPETVEACKRLKEKGYTIALDDFVPNEANLPLVDYADIIKIEFPYVPQEEQLKLIKKYGSKAKMLAEKVETRADFFRAIEMGYDLFQGYFFSKPTVIKAREIEALNVNILRVMSELNKTEPSYDEIALIVEGDLGLSYKILKLVNSVYFGSRHSIKAIPNALAYLGLNELQQWFCLMLLKDIQNVENAEMIKTSLIRGKLMELLAKDFCDSIDKTEAFFTGIFSSMDVLLNKPMQDIMSELPLSDGVKKALIGEQNDCRRLLDYVIDSESPRIDKAQHQAVIQKISVSRFMELYLEALRWAKMLNY